MSRHVIPGSWTRRTEEHGPKLVMQDRGTSSLFASAERNRGRPGTEVSNVQKRDR